MSWCLLCFLCCSLSGCWSGSFVCIWRKKVHLKGRFVFVTCRHPLVSVVSFLAYAGRSLFRLLAAAPYDPLSPQHSQKNDKPLIFSSFTNPGLLLLRLSAMVFVQQNKNQHIHDILFLHIIWSLCFPLSWYQDIAHSSCPSCSCSCSWGEKTTNPWYFVSLRNPSSPYYICVEQGDLFRYGI